MNEPDFEQIMENDELDLSFVGVYAELQCLAQHFSLLRSAYADAKQSIAARAERGSGFPELQDSEQQMADYDSEVVLSRLVWGGFIVTVWAVFEDAVIEIADFLRAAKGIPLRIVEIKGDLRDQIKRYFDDVLNFEFADYEGQNWEQLVVTNRVRHLMAHRAGRLENLSSKELLEVEKIVQNNAGIELDQVLGTYLVVGLEFAEGSLRAIDKVLLVAVHNAKQYAKEVKQ